MFVKKFRRILKRNIYIHLKQLKFKAWIEIGMSNQKHYLHVRYCGDVEHNCHLFMVIDDIMLHT